MTVQFKQTVPPDKKTNGDTLLVGVLYDDARTSGQGSAASPYPESLSGTTLTVDFIAKWAAGRFATLDAQATNTAVLATKVGQPIAAGATDPTIAAVLVAQRAFFSAQRNASVNGRPDPVEQQALKDLVVAEDARAKALAI